MPKFFRAALAIAGLAVAVYGVSNLTGSWLGSPPWWTREARVDRALSWMGQGHEFVAAYWGQTIVIAEPRPGRERWSVALAAAGLALALAAWPRRFVRPCPGESSRPPSFDARRLLFIPSYLAAGVVAAGLAEDWSSVLAAQLGALAPLGPTGSGGVVEVATSLMGRLLVLACVLTPTVKSIRRPGFGWVLVLVPAWFLWFIVGWPQVWRA